MKTICSPKRSSAAAIASLVLLSLFVCCCSVIAAAAAIIGDPGIVGVFFPERESDDSGGAIGIGGGGVLARSAAGVGLKVLQLWHQFSFWLQFEHCSGFAGGDEMGLGGGEGACACTAAARCCCCCWFCWCCITSTLSMAVL